MDYEILSLIPALLTIAIALLTHRVALALFVGVLGGAIVLAGYQPLLFLRGSFEYMLIAFGDIERLKIVLFVILIGGMLEIIAGSGAYTKFAGVMARRLSTPRRSRVGTWALSMCLFFDDYANVLISGATMRNINIRNRVSPAQLAYIIDVVATIASVVIISTWASFEGSVMAEAGKDAGIHKSFTTFFLESLPYHFYTFLAIIMAFVVAYTGKWFGYRADNATYHLREPTDVNNPRARPIHLLAPIIALIGSALIALFLSGFYILKNTGEPVSLIKIIGAAPSLEILILATLLATGLGIMMLRRDKAMSPALMKRHFLKGIKGMTGVSLVIILAKGLSAVSADLGTGNYLTGAVSSFLSPKFIPFMIFSVSMVITMATGFSWSSMAIVMPIAFQMVHAANIPDIIPIVSGAVISGAVSGEHIIPFSEKAVMSAAACKITPVYHIKTQILQSISVFLAAAGSYMIIGVNGSLALAFFIPLSVLLSLHFFFARKNAHAAFVWI
ncbi:MAG: Na+/H+ antiporter NhaC family protein [Bacteroidales bacterium]|nr:hypothetical protein [Bacteroidales bacterium]MBS3773773.1 hypothetical protein [Bacteroidales bacterium]